MKSVQTKSLRLSSVRAACVVLAVLPCMVVAAAEDAGFDCRQAVIAGLLNETHDVAKLRCAAQTLIAAANSDAGNYNNQLAALRANALYIYYLDRIVLYQLGYLIVWYVDDVPEEKLLSEPMIALQAARQEQLHLLQQAREAGFENIELDYFEALGIGAQASAIPLLKKVVAEDPPGLHGAAHALLAETYYALPDIVGGDLDLAIALMREAQQRAPDNPRYPRLLAGYLLDKDQVAAARVNLKQLLAMKAETSGRQLKADQLRAAVDLAGRMGDTELAQQLIDQRNAMLEAYPFLLTRNVVSAMGHFGSNDPMKNPD